MISWVLGKVLKLVFRLVMVLVVLAAIGVAVLTITEYRPENVETVIKGGTADAVPIGQEMSALIWNVGYGALGENADFFMDGGKSVYTADEARVKDNVQNILAELQRQNADFMMLQEVDINSDRSYHIDERETLKQAAPGGTDAFAYNFKALYVPYPLPPIGHVEGGLYTLSQRGIAAADRIALPTPFTWPMRTVNLKRCLLVSRIPVAGSGRQLVLVNLHLEAYDDGTGKAAQTRVLQDLLRSEYDKGNYVIAGGNFNQQFAGVVSPYRSEGAPWQAGKIDPAGFEPDFQMLMDASVPTCRALNKPYAGADKEKFYFYMIDGFIVSDNVEVREVRTIDMGFRHSDHNPVRLTFALRPEVNGGKDSSARASE